MPMTPMISPRLAALLGSGSGLAAPQITGGPGPSMAPPPNAIGPGAQLDPSGMMPAGIGGPGFLGPPIIAPGGQHIPGGGGPGPTTIDPGAIGTPGPGGQQMPGGGPGPTWLPPQPGGGFQGWPNSLQALIAMARHGHMPWQQQPPTPGSDPLQNHRWRGQGQPPMGGLPPGLAPAPITAAIPGSTIPGSTIIAPRAMRVRPGNLRFG